MPNGRNSYMFERVLLLQTELILEYWMRYYGDGVWSMDYRYRKVLPLFIFLTWAPSADETL